MIEVRFSGELIAKFEDEENFNKWFASVDEVAKKYLVVVKQ